MFTKSAVKNITKNRNVYKKFVSENNFSFGNLRRAMF